MENELAVAIEAAREAGAVVRRWFDSQGFSVKQKEGGMGPLTEADLEANAILVDFLRSAFPDDGLLSEETLDTPDRLSKSRVWILDPIDGTREFTKGVPEFCVSVGFAVDGEARVGALYNPATDEMIAGAVGLGCTLNGEPCGVSARARLDSARFLVSRTEHEKGWFDGWPDATPCGSVAWKLGLVAAGRVEATFTPRPRCAWDVCAGVACVAAAGGAVTNRHGAPYVFNQADPVKDGVCGTNGVLHEAVLERLRSVG